MQQRQYEYFSNEDFRVDINEAGGFVFLHLEMLKWSKSALKELKLLVDLIAADFKHKGHDVIFATSDNEKTVRFWNMVRPVDILKRYGPNDKYYLGSWIIMEEEDGD